MIDGGEGNSLPAGQTTGDVRRPSGRQADDAGKVVLVTRLLVGLLTSRSGDLFQRLEELQDEIVLETVRSPGAGSGGVETSGDLMRYLVIGLLLQSERRVTRSIRGGMSLAIGLARKSMGTMDRLTDNPFGRPVRRRLAGRGRSLGDQLVLLIEEGRREEAISKLLAGEGMGVIVDEVVEVIAENPELDHLVGELIAQKSKGLATVVGDNARTLAATGDDVAEGALRKLLRRTPRQALPPSPLEGKPQTMYAPATSTEGEVRNDG
ncbi:hypothetical protein ACFLT5_03145 [Chloroflexota bacterium]